MSPHMIRLPKSRTIC